jgi:hypothetical protein
MTTQEKRKFIRIDSLNLSYVLVDGTNDEEKQTMGRTLNVSEAGIRLETHVPVELNSTLTLTIGLEKDDKASQILKKFIKAFKKQRKKSD